MEKENALIGMTAQPTEAEVAAVLDKSAPVWTEFVRWMADVQGVAEQEGKSSSPKYGWSLRLKRKKRTIVYLGPCKGCFRVAFVLGDRAVEAARACGLPKPVLHALEEAPHYSEGTGLRLLVKARKDLAAVRKLVLVKLAN